LTAADKALIRVPHDVLDSLGRLTLPQVLAAQARRIVYMADGWIVDGPHGRPIEGAVAAAGAAHG